jgi:single-stranded DNA-binding protein
VTIMRLTFAGTITKAEPKMAGDKPIVEVSLCKKHKSKGEDTFTWIRVTIWQPAEFQVAKLVKGNFIAGQGDVQLRSYEHNGEKRSSLEVRCTSFDVEVAAQEVRGETAQAPAAKPSQPAYTAPVSDSEPPFNRSELEAMP